MWGPMRYSCRSVPQIPHHSMSIRTWVGVGIGVGMREMRMSWGAWNWAARIFMGVLRAWGGR